MKGRACLEPRVEISIHFMSDSKIHAFLIMPVRQHQISEMHSSQGAFGLRYRLPWGNYWLGQWRGSPDSRERVIGVLALDMNCREGGS